jgi:uncharacterized protein (TIRG00374 family)
LPIESSWKEKKIMAFPLKPKFKKWVSISAVLGFAVFLVYLVFFTNMGEVVGVLGKTNPIYYAVAFACVLGSVVFNTLTWQRLLSNVHVNTKFSRVFNLSWVGMFVDAIGPGGWSGDIFKSYLLSKDTNGDGARVAASIVLKKVLEFLITLTALVVGMLLLVFNYSIGSGILLIIGATMFLLALPLVIMIYLSTNIGATKKLIRLLNRLLTAIKRKKIDGSGFEAKMQNSLNEFHDGILTIRKNPKSIIQPMAFQTIAWGFDIVALFMIFVSLGYFVGSDKVIITNSIVTNIQTQGFALAGFAQLISSNVYTVLGILPQIAIASSLLAGFASFWFKTIISFFAFQRTVLSPRLPIITSANSGISSGKSGGKGFFGRHLLRRFKT